MQRQNLSREELIKKIGGDNQYNFLVTSFCENIQQDPGLKHIFLSFDIELLAVRMTSLLDIALSQSSDSDALDRSSYNKVIMNYFDLFEAGMNVKHFKKLQVNFETALHDAWVAEDMIEQCIRRFAKLERVFEEEGAIMEQNETAERIVEFRIMVANSA